MAISNVQNEGSWIRVYDEKSKRISEMSASNKEVVGIGSDFFVTEEGSWIGAVLILVGESVFSLIFRLRKSL